MHHHFRRNGALLDDAAVFCQIALQNGNAAAGRIRVVNRADDALVAVDDAFEVLRHGLARAGHHRRVEQALLRQLLHHGEDAARAVEVFHERITRRRKVAEVRRVGGNLVRVVKVDGHACFVRDGGQVEHRVRGAAERHVNGFSVVERGRGHDVARADVLLHQRHNLHPSVLGEAQTRGVWRGNRAVARKPHPQRFGQAVHGVRGIHAGAAAAGRAGVFLIVADAVVIQRACLVCADCLEHVAQTGAATVGQVSSEHWAARNEDGWDVQPRRRHQQPRHVFIAVGNHHQTVKLVGDGHCFSGISNQIAGDEGVLHADVPHGDPVADGNRGEENRRAARRADARFDGFGDFVQIHMPGDDFIIGGNDADERLADFLIGQTEGIEQRAVGGAFHALLDVFGQQGNSLLMLIASIF